MVSTPSAQPADTGLPAPSATVRDYLRLLRPQQWYKNGLVLAGAIFSGQILLPHVAAVALAGAGLFCLLSSGVYALNDAVDARTDRLHPIKRKRPVAAGRIPMTTAALVGILLVGIALAGGWFLHPVGLGTGHGFLAAEIGYALLQALYITVLRRHFLLDLASISGGFLLRSLAGVVLVAVPLSPWLFLCTLFMAVFLGLGKRRKELMVLGADAAKHRATLGEYTLPFLDKATTIVATALLVSYSLYTFFHTRVAMMATIPFVMYGLFRYLHLMESKGIGGEPEAIFGDIPSLVNLLLWVLAVVIILYWLPDSLQGQAHRLIFGP